MTEYQDTMPPSAPSASSRASIDPTSKRRPGYSLRARSIMGSRKVQAEGVQPEVPEGSRSTSGPAAELSYEPAARSKHVLRERGQHRPIQRLVVQRTPDE